MSTWVPFSLSRQAARARHGDRLGGPRP